MYITSLTKRILCAGLSLTLLFLPMAGNAYASDLEDHKEQSISQDSITAESSENQDSYKSDPEIADSATEGEKEGVSAENSPECKSENIEASISGAGDGNEASDNDNSESFDIEKNEEEAESISKNAVENEEDTDNITKEKDNTAEEDTSKEEKSATAEEKDFEEEIDDDATILETQELIAEVDDYVITAAGRMPLGCSLMAEQLSYTDRAEEIINEDTSDQISFTVYSAFDIQILDKDGEVWQPQDYEESISISISGIDFQNNNSIEVHRISDDEKNVDVMDSEVIDDDTIEFITDHFTTFTISGTTYTTDNDWYKYWNYALDTEHKYIILITYGKDASGNTISGTPTDVIVPASATISGTTYHTVILSNSYRAWYDGSSMKSVSSSVSPFYNNTSITSVVFEDMVHTGLAFDISGYFYGCTKLTSVDLSGLYVNSGALDKRRYVSNAMQTFYNCKSLNHINWGNIKFSECYSLKETFYGCESLTSLECRDWDVSRVTSMASTFSGCTKLSDLDVSQWNTGKVTDMSKMFNYCRSLTEIDAGNWNTASVKDMNSMFNSCTGITSLDIGNWQTGEVTNMSSMFYNCVKIACLDISDWNTANVTNMSNMFYNCSALTSLGCVNWDTGNVTDMSLMFRECDHLTSLDVSKWDTSSVTNMRYLFGYCEGLSSLDVSKWDTGNVTSMGSMFTSCYALESIDVSKWNTSKLSNMYSMFNSCGKLTELDMSNWDTSNVTSMGYMFFGCTGLKELNVSGWDTSKVTSIEYIFRLCKGIDSLNLSEWDLSSVSSSNQAISGCEFKALKTPKKTGAVSLTLPYSMYELNEDGITVSNKAYSVLDASVPAQRWIYVSNKVTYKTELDRTLYTENIAYGMDASPLHDDLDWYGNAALTYPADLTSVTEEKTVYTNALYTVRYHANNGTDAYKDTYCKLHEKFTTIASDFTKGDLSVTGWNSLNSGNGQIYEVGDEYGPYDTDGELVELYAMYGNPSAIKGSYVVSVPALITLKSDSDDYYAATSNISVTGNLRKNDYVEITMSDFDIKNSISEEKIGIAVTQSKSRWTKEDLSIGNATVKLKSKTVIDSVAGSFYGAMPLTIRSGSSVE